MEENKSIEETTQEPQAVKTQEPGLAQDKLLSVLTQKQKKALGLLPEKYQSEKAKARNEMLRERMRKINEDRKASAKTAVKGVIKPKRERSEPSDQEEEESSSEDKVIQKKAKKVHTTIKHLSKVEERLLELQQQNRHNPFFSLMMRK